MKPRQTEMRHFWRSQGFLQEQQDLKQLLGADLWCVTQHRAQVPRLQMNRCRSSSDARWAHQSHLGASSVALGGCDAPQFILQGKKCGSDSCPSQSCLPEPHHKRSRALLWALIRFLTQLPYAFLEIMGVLPTPFSSEFNSCFTKDKEDSLWVEQNTARRKPTAGTGKLYRSGALIPATKEYTIIHK